MIRCFAAFFHSESGKPSVYFMLKAQVIWDQPCPSTGMPRVSPRHGGSASKDERKFAQRTSGSALRPKAR